MRGPGRPTRPRSEHPGQVLEENRRIINRYLAAAGSTRFLHDSRVGGNKGTRGAPGEGDIRGGSTAAQIVSTARELRACGHMERKEGPPGSSSRTSREQTSDFAGFLRGVRDVNERSGQRAQAEDSRGRRDVDEPRDGGSHVGTNDDAGTGVIVGVGRSHIRTSTRRTTRGALARLASARSHRHENYEHRVIQGAESGEFWPGARLYSAGIVLRRGGRSLRIPTSPRAERRPPS